MIYNESKVKSIRKLNKKGRVINLTVNKNHTFVTANGIVTHNCDGLSQNAQRALRGIIEEYYQNCRFIMTANYENKLIDALKSRCPVIDFNFDKSEKHEMMKVFLPRVAGILTENNIEFDKKELVNFCATKFPDIRKTLQLLQRNSNNGKLTLDYIGSSNDEKIQELVTTLVNRDFDDMSKWVASNLDNDGHIIRRSLYNVLSKQLKPESIGTLILILNDYDRFEVQVKDLEIHMKAMCITIMQECEFKD